jgi:hypothetical protein
MSTTHAAAHTASGKNEIRIISHSGLFYWWPVWAVGFLMAGITALEDSRLATVPGHSNVYNKAEGKLTYQKSEHEVSTVSFKDSGVLVSPEGKQIKGEEPHLHISNHKSYGVLFATVLLLVIAITNIPMRGLWSVIVIVVIVSLVIILALMRAWEHIFATLSFLDIRINMGGYLFISLILLGIWLVIFLLFDQQIYMVFTPGQFRVRLEIGEGETAYDTTGMTLQKQRSDLFRHWILGLGSGDLIVRTSGAQGHQYDLHNVLFVGRKLREIEEMLRARAVVAARPED